MSDNETKRTEDTGDDDAKSRLRSADANDDDRPPAPLMITLLRGLVMIGVPGAAATAAYQATHSIPLAMLTLAMGTLATVALLNILSRR